ncbi:hypothetical protein D3C75_781480 [compost metagenome]
MRQVKREGAEQFGKNAGRSGQNNHFHIKDPNHQFPQNEYHHKGQKRRNHVACHFFKSGTPGFTRIFHCAVPLFAFSQNRAAARVRYEVTHSPLPPFTQAFPKLQHILMEFRSFNDSFRPRPGQLNIDNARDASWTAGHNHDFVRQIHCLLNVMGDKNNRLVVLIPDFHQLIHQLLSRDFIQS